jgi:hypothetical protein
MGYLSILGRGFVCLFLGIILFCFSFRFVFFPLVTITIIFSSLCHWVLFSWGYFLFFSFHRNFFLPFFLEDALHKSERGPVEYDLRTSRHTSLCCLLDVKALTGEPNWFASSKLLCKPIGSVMRGLSLQVCRLFLLGSWELLYLAYWKDLRGRTPVV